LIEANGGTVFLGYYSQSVANAGTLEATGSSSTLMLGTGNTPWTNTGNILATANGTVDLGGSFTTANLTSGTINANTGGVLNITGSLNNASATLTPPNSGIYTLSGGTITGGTAASGALTFSGTPGSLSGVTMNGNFSLPTAASASFFASNNTTFTGGTTTFPTTVGDTVYLTGPSSSTALTIAPSATWSGDMAIYNQASNPLDVLVQGIVNHIAGSTYFYGSGYGLTLVNSGTIEASGGGSLTLGYYSGDTVTNQAGGTIEANGATVYLDDSSSSVTNLAGGVLTGGTWMAVAGGQLNFFGAGNTVVTNGAGTTLVLDGSTSSFVSGSSGHTLEQTLTTNNGTLEILTNRNFPSTSTGIANNGTIQLGGGTLTAASLNNGSGSLLSGFGTFNPTGGAINGSGVALSPGSASANHYVATLTFNSLTLGPSGTYTFDVENAGGAAGVGYDTIGVTGTLNASAATSFIVNLESISPGTGTPGAATFNAATSYQWTLFSSSSLTSFNPADFTVNSSLFTNSLGGGSFSFTSVGNNIDLNFTPVPEPSTWALMAAGVSVLAFAGFRRRAIRA
jgi:hypothetical protein